MTGEDDGVRSDGVRGSTPDGGVRGGDAQHRDARGDDPPDGDAAGDGRRVPGPGVEIESLAAFDSAVTGGALAPDIASSPST